MRLRDCFAELIAYVAYFLKTDTTSNLSFGQVQTDVQRLLSESESLMRDGGIASEEYNEARFAVCAWVDEALLSSNWPGKVEWQRDSLQRKYFQTSDAGEEFFDRLNRLGQQQRDAREMYFLCLAMGFKGRYHQDGDEPAAFEQGGIPHFAPQGTVKEILNEGGGYYQELAVGRGHNGRQHGSQQHPAKDWRE